MQCDNIGACQQILQPCCRLRIAQRQLGVDIVENHPHAQCFGQHAHLGADMAIAHDTQGLAAHLVAAGGGFRPPAAMAFGVFLRDAACQQHCLRHHQFGHAAGIGVGRIEYRNAGLFGSLQIHLIGADAEAANRQQALGIGQDLGAELGARTQAHDMRLTDARLQLVFRQCLAVVFDLAVAGGLEDLHCGLADAFQQQHPDVLFREGGLLAGHACRVPGGE